MSRQEGSRRDCSLWLATRAEGLVDLGRFDEARDLLAEAIGIAVDLRDEVGEAHCRLALARAEMGQGLVVEAGEQLRRARLELDSRAEDGTDLDVLRLEVDLLACRDEWQRAGEQAGRLVAGRRRARVPLDLAADIARLACAAQHHGDAGATADGLTEVAALLDGLHLTQAALRLPSPPYPEDLSLLADG